MSKETEKPYGYYLVGHHYEHDYSDEVFEFFQVDSTGKDALEERIKQLLNMDPYPYREEDIHVIRGSEATFMVEKEVTKKVEVKDCV